MCNRNNSTKLLSSIASIETIAQLANCKGLINCVHVCVCGGGVRERERETFIRPFTGTGCWGKIDTGTAADKDHHFRLSWKIADLSWPLVISNKFPQHKTICL